MTDRKRIAMGAMPPDPASTTVALPDFLPGEPANGGTSGADPNTASGEIRLDAPGRYMLEIEPAPTRMPFLRLAVRLRSQADRVVYVPTAGRTSYLLESGESWLVLQFDSRDIVASSIRRLRIRDLGALLRQGRRRKRFELPLGKGIVLRPLLHLSGPEGREMALALRGLAGWGFGTASDNLQKTLSRHFNGRPVQAPQRLPTSEPRIAVALHLHYVDLWPEFEALLEAIDRPFQLILTLTRPDAALTERVQARFRGAEILVYENRGRDVGPFIQLLHEGRLDSFDLVCKLHGKKSGLSGPRMLLGEIWRRAILFDLIGSRDVVDRIVAEFEHSRETRMIGSRRFRLPNEWKREKAAWGENRAMVRNMLLTMGMSADSRLDFFAGTMFWVRRGALEPLKQLGLSLASFPDEASQQDGTLQHALERVLGLISAKISGVAWDDE
ncbi:MAG: rhamnan synthesis F [Mesorhizobium sp.]|nr:MAG: rhamnan synthesis F [Mesorhizobium sp.]